jgi:hypothetical protein
VISWIIIKYDIKNIPWRHVEFEVHTAVTEEQALVRSNAMYCGENATSLFNSEDSGDIFIRSVGLSPNHTTLQPSKLFNYISWMYALVSLNS